MTVNFAGGGEQKYSSNIVSISHFTDATRNIELQSNSAYIAIEFDFTKTAADTSIVLWGYSPMAFQNSYHAGWYAEIGEPSSSNYTRYYEAAHYVSPHDNAQADGNYQTLYWSGYWDSTATGLNASGTRRVRLGWQTRDGSNQRPGQRLNPDKQSDRTRERTTQITVMEVYANINRFT